MKSAITTSVAVLAIIVSLVLGLFVGIEAIEMQKTTITTETTTLPQATITQTQVMIRTVTAYHSESPAVTIVEVVVKEYSQLYVTSSGVTEP